jgi:hypothetical protein
MRTRSLLALSLLLLLSACSTAPRREQPTAAAPPLATPPRPLVVCRDCGRIEKVEMVDNVRATGNGHAVLGGVVGGVVAGKPATPADATRPGVQVLTFRIGVRMDDGRRLTLHQPDLASGLRAGSRIRVANNRVLPPR